MSARPCRTGHAACRRAAAEVDVADVQQDSFLAPGPGVIQGAEQGVIPGRRRILARRRDPAPQEGEELRHPLRVRRRILGRRIVTDVAGGVELIDRAGQPDPERGLDLGSLAGLQETVEPLEHLKVVPAGRDRPARAGQLPDYPVHVLGGDFPRRAAQRGQHPLQQPGVIANRRVREPPRRPRRNKRLHAVGLERCRIRRHFRWDELTCDDTKPGLRHAHTFPAPRFSRQRLAI